MQELLTGLQIAFTLPWSRSPAGQRTIEASLRRSLASSCALLALTAVVAAGETDVNISR